MELERFGTFVNDARGALEFLFDNEMSRAERDELIDSMVATMQLG